jgi:hypothetical protein
MYNISRGENMSPKKKIATQWYIEIDVIANNNHFILSSKILNNPITINLISDATGEIRQKKVSIDQIARKMFESEISTWKDIGLEDMK